MGGNKERRVLGKSIVYGTNPQAPSAHQLNKEQVKEYAQTSSNNANNGYVSVNQ